MGAPTSERAVAKLMCAAADKDGDGKINASEFKKHLTPVGSWSAASEDEVFKRADTDGDGQLSEAEMATSFRIGTAWPGLADSKWDQEQLRQSFSTFDSDGDGIVSEEECKEWYRRLDTNGDGKVSSAELAEASSLARQKLSSSMMKLGDGDNNGALDEGEWHKALSNFCQHLSESQRSELMKLADTDGDGLVSESELNSLIAKLDVDGDGKLSESELPGSSSSLVAGTASALEPWMRQLTRLAPANARMPCQAAIQILCAYLRGGSVAGAVAGAAWNIATSPAAGLGLFEHAYRWLKRGRQAAAANAPAQEQAIQSPPACPVQQAASNVTAQEPPFVQQASSSQVATIDSTSPICSMCRNANGALLPPQCCGRPVCRRCIARIIIADIPVCPFCKGTMELLNLRA